MSAILHNYHPCFIQNIFVMKAKVAGASVAKLVREYVGSHPEVKECMRRRLISYTALAREVCAHYKQGEVSSAAVALQRYTKNLKVEAAHSRMLDSLFKNATLLARTGLSIAVIQRPYSLPALQKVWREIRDNGSIFQHIEAERVLTLIYERRFTRAIKEAFGKNIRSLVHEVVQLSLGLPEKSMLTPGVSARLSGAFAAAGINLLEELTCSGEYLIVIAESDLPSAIALLNTKEQ